MPRKPSAGSKRSKAWRGPDDAPELTDDFFRRANWYRGRKLVRRGSPPGPVPKRPVTIRIDIDVIAHFQKAGPAGRAASMLPWGGPLTSKARNPLADRICRKLSIMAEEKDALSDRRSCAAHGVRRGSFLDPRSAKPVRPGALWSRGHAAEDVAPASRRLADVEVTSEAREVLCPPTSAIAIFVHPRPVAAFHHRVESHNTVVQIRFDPRYRNLEIYRQTFHGRFLRIAVPSGVPRPVHASQPAPAV